MPAPICLVSPEPASQEDEANARLIAAAPAMLRALQSIQLQAERGAELAATPLGKIRFQDIAATANEILNPDTDDEP